MNDAELMAELGVFRAVAQLFPRARKLISTPGRKIRPLEVEALTSGKLSRQQLEMLQESHAKIQAALDRMPGGVPRTVQDMRTVLPHINPVAFTNNCTECAMAVDDVLAGRAAVAANSRHTDVLPDRLGGVSNLKTGYTPDTIEQELRQTEGARGVVLMSHSNGQAHTSNVANLGGKVYWMDGQFSALLTHKGERLAAISDEYLYKEQNFERWALMRTDGLPT